MITASYGNRRYVLLSTRADGTMLADDRDRPWGVERVEITRDERGKPVVGITFDDAGARRVGSLTRSTLAEWRVPVATLIRLASRIAEAEDSQALFGELRIARHNVPGAYQPSPLCLFSACFGDAHRHQPR